MLNIWRVTRLKKCSIALLPEQTDVIIENAGEIAFHAIKEFIKNSHDLDTVPAKSELKM